MKAEASSVCSLSPPQRGGERERSTFARRCASTSPERALVLRTSPAQMSQSCARLAAQVQFIISEDALLYMSFVSLSIIFSFFLFLLTICLLALLSGFLDGD